MNRTNWRFSDVVGWDSAAVIFLFWLGLLHVPLQWVSDLSWEDSRSFRKPILFGISTGLTLASLLWLMNDLRPRRWDVPLRRVLCGTLVLEVLLITVQSWRRVPSHFNHATPLDVVIEVGMLVCILIAVVAIVRLTFRAFQREAFKEVGSARILAQRSGMLFLLISCAIGIGITLIGNYQMILGKSPETYGGEGVLKFPHGAVLHAIQTLVLWSWIGDFFKWKRVISSTVWLVVSHLFFLFFAMRQTGLGRARWDCDQLGWLLLGGAIAAGLASLLVALWPAGTEAASSSSE
jgi:hypothetical protein